MKANINASYDSTKKDDRIYFRISFGDKERYKEEARQLGLSLSEYINHILNHKGIIMIDGKEELLDAIDELASTVKECIAKPPQVHHESVECPFTYVIPDDAIDYE